MARAGSIRSALRRDLNAVVRAGHVQRQRMRTPTLPVGATVVDDDGVRRRGHEGGLRQVAWPWRPDHLWQD